MLLPGTVVRVRPWEEIARTLDGRGTLEGLPFMDEMRSCCGESFTVTRRLERTCDESTGEMRRIRNVVFLDALRCDGSAHGGCQKGCRLFWKEAWLHQDERTIVAAELGGNVRAIVPSGPHKGDRYVCQSTELIRASTRLSNLDVGCYWRDLRARTYSARELLTAVAFAAWLRLRRLLTGRSYRVVEGLLDKTPTESLELQSGEWVEVKCEEEIARTLDRNGKNRGLAFTVEMLPFCGREFRVLRRVERMIHEPSGELMPVKSTVILEGVTCDGCHIMRGGCPRDNYHLWREVWLRRMD